MSAPLAITPREISAFKRLPAWTVSELAEQGGRRLTAGPRAGATWRNADAPHLVKVMDTCGHPWVREETVAAGNQVGKTVAADNCWAWYSRYTPGPAMYVFQDEMIADKVMRDRMTPMIKQTKFLADRMTDSAHDTGLKRIAFDNGSLLYPAWYGSVSSTETVSVEFLFEDEADTAQANGVKVNLNTVEQRVVAYPHTSKILRVCKPLTEQGPIWTAYLAADVRYTPWLVCPECAHHFPAEWKSASGHWLIQYPADIDPAEIRRRRLAWLACPGCDAHLPDSGRDAAVALAHKLDRLWVPDAQIERPVHVAFNIPSWMAQWVSIHQLAYEWLRAQQAKKRGNLKPLITFTTAREAKPYIEHHAPRDTDAIYILKEDRPRGAVPRDTVALVAAGDTQDDGLYYEIRAGRNPQPSALTTHLVREGYISNAASNDLLLLESILFEDLYTDAEATMRFIVNLALQDAMGHRTEEVYKACQRRPGLWVPTQGHQRIARPFYYSTIDTYPGSNRPIPGGIQLLHFSTTHYKNELNRRLQIPPGDLGSWNLHNAITADYANQMTVEYRDTDTGLWVCPEGKDNHYWDTGVLCLVAFGAIDAEFIPAPGTIIHHQPTEPQPTNRNPHPPARHNRPW